MPDENFGMWRDIAANEQRNRTNQRLANIEAELARQQANVVAKCPACDGDLSKIGVPLCKHCSSKLVWFKHCVALEGEEELAEKRYRNWLTDQEAKANNRQALIEVKEAEMADLNETCKPLLFLGLGIFIIFFLGCFAGILVGGDSDWMGFFMILAFGSIFLGGPVILIATFAMGCHKASDIKEELENMRSRGY